MSRRIHLVHAPPPPALPFRINLNAGFRWGLAQSMRQQKSIDPNPGFPPGLIKSMCN
jgi:hypothetical protein